jgi:hypothetical protein
VPGPQPRPIITDHVRVRCRQKDVDVAAITFVCQVAPVEDYDEVNESYRLDQWVAGGLLRVAIEARAYEERGQFVVKTAYWLRRPPSTHGEQGTQR